MLWDEEEIRINLRHAHKFFLHVMTTSADEKKWELTTVYASPDETIKNHLWDKLNEMGIDGPWIPISDFNCVLKGE